MEVGSGPDVLVRLRATGEVHPLTAEGRHHKGQVLLHIRRALPQFRTSDKVLAGAIWLLGSVIAFGV